MKAFTSTLCRAALVVLLTPGGLVSITGCHRLPVSLAAEASPEPATDPVGQHALTASPPVTTSDLDRLLGLGFTVDEVVSEIERRGVLKLPDPVECEHILRFPRGDRLLDTMERPGNLLTTAAVTSYGRRQAGAPNLEQWQAARAATAQQAAFQMQGRVQTSTAQQQQYTQYQLRRAALASQINTLKRQRQALQQRGQITVTITMQIERLEREQASLVSPL